MELKAHSYFEIHVSFLLQEFPWKIGILHWKSWVFALHVERRVSPKSQYRLWDSIPLSVGFR